MLQITEKPNAPPRAQFYKGKYLVAEDGRLFTMTRGRHLSIHQQKSRRQRNGYYVVNIHGRTEYLHKVVAYCFVSNPNGYVEINHKDGNKGNNNAENLEWCTRSQNLKHAGRLGLIGNAPRIHRVLSSDQAKQVKEMLRNGYSGYAIAKFFHCHEGTVFHIKCGRSYKEA